MLQGVTSVQVWQTATRGLSRSMSVSPVAFHMALAPAREGPFLIVSLGSVMSESILRGEGRQSYETPGLLSRLKKTRAPLRERGFQKFCGWSERAPYLRGSRIIRVTRGVGLIRKASIGRVDFEVNDYFGASAAPGITMRRSAAEGSTASSRRISAPRRTRRTRGADPGFAGTLKRPSRSAPNPWVSVTPFASTVYE